MIEAHTSGESGKETARSRLATPRVFGGIVLLGIALRLIQYLWNHSYWHDEVYLVVNIVDGSLRDAFGPLRLDQTTPPLFLMAQIGIRHLLGSSEYVLRLLPLLLGCASVPLMWLFGRRLAVGSIAALFATTLFALSDRLIWHAAECKQYSGDVLCSLLLWLAASAVHRGEERRQGRGFVLVGLLAAALVWMSHPIVFVFGGISAAAMLAILMSRTHRLLLPWIAANAIFADSFVALYLLSVRHQQYPYLASYWEEDMVPWRDPMSIVPWAVRAAFDLFDYPYEKCGAALLPLAIAGAVALWRGNRRVTLALLVGPIALNVLAAALHRYPLAGTRVTLYLAPSLLLLPAIGTQWLLHTAARTQIRWQRSLAVGLPVALILFGGGLATLRLFSPRHRGNVREPAAVVRARHLPGVPVYALREAAPAQFYLRGIPVEELKTLEELAAIPHREYWVLYGYSGWRTLRERRAAMAILSRRAKIAERVEIDGGAAFLMRAGDANPSSAPAR